LVPKGLPPVPGRIAVFGAGAHIGGPLAQFVQRASPQTALRLVTSSPSKTASLKDRFPGTELAVASYFDVPALEAAFDGVDGIFIVTPDFIDDQTAMANVAAAAKKSGTVTRIVRVLADLPGMSLDKLPADMRAMGHGPAMQHFQAREVLDASGISISYVNSPGWFMDDFLIHFAGPLKAKHKVVIPFDRLICFTDTRDLGEACGRILLSEDPEFVGRYHNFNSGEPSRRFSEAVAMMSDIVGTTITYDPTPEGFLAELGPTLFQMTGDNHAAEYFIVNWAMERDYQEAYYGSTFGQRILGRQPRTLRDWLIEHKDRLI
jgi:uncharacterized protein YbjT (DUF2867 family)